MGEVIVIQFATLDGVVSDPDGRWGTGYGGWAFRYGTGPVNGDKFRLGDRMEKGVQLYGRRTWEHFAQLWPSRDTDYAKVMTAVEKRIATRTKTDATTWANSAVIEGDPLAWVADERTRRDIVVIGSLSLVRALATADLIDEYRLVVFPLTVGEGDRLPITADFRFTTVEQVDETAFVVLRRRH